MHNDGTLLKIEKQNYKAQWINFLLNFNHSNNYHINETTILNDDQLKLSDHENFVRI